MPVRRTQRVLFFFLITAMLVFAAPASFAQCVSLTTIGSAYTQNFDTLSNTAGSTTNNLTITGWFMTETGGGARDNEQYAVDTGGSTTGDTYSYGAAASTERALGGLRSGTLIPNFGSCYTNNTGVTITSLAVAYNGEEWRFGTLGRADQINFEYSTNATDLTTGTWTNVAALNFVTPDTASVGAKNGNAAADRTALSASVPSLSIANGATFWIRWTDIDVTGADDGLAVDDFSLTPQNTPVTPTLNVGDVTLGEGDPPGTTTFNFVVSLTAPAGAGGVSFTWSTADGTATLADNDYVQVTPTAGSISAGNNSTTLSVTVNRDLTPEPNETFFVNVSGITNANAGDTQGQGTINNDDVTITKIHDVQGNGTSSPIVGSNVTVKGIVTGVKSNGFFVQEEDADADADPNTSEGVFVFTSSAPPAAAAFTAQVQVNGTVSEFVPSSDPQQPPLTELSGAITVTQTLPAGQPLPTAITLTPTNPNPAGPFDQMEKFEGMRVTATSMTVSGPSDGTVNESAATGTSNGRFHAVVTGVAKPFREPGIQAPDLPPTGTIPPIPRWDTNPENLRIESATINSQPVLTVRSNDVVGPIAGPLDYGFRGYAIYPDGTLGTPVVTPGTLNTMVTTPTAQEFTVASYNLERFFDTTDDPESDAVLTATAFNNRLLKASIAIRNHLKFPDIVGVQEMEHLSTLQALATQINNDAVANAQPNPQYVAYLTEGNDVGGIDVGYLVKTAPVTGGAPRVAVNSVTQIGAATTYIDPTTGSPATLNDRPPLVLDATINRGPGSSFNVIIINNHLRSLLSLTDETPSGPTTVGDRVRRKRQLQADFLAQYIQGRLTATPGEHIIVIGDMNNFEFNDGYQDSLDTITGTPVPDNQTVVCSTCPQPPNTGDGVDQLNPDLTNLVNTPPPAERYSYNFDGNAQNIDHAVVSPGLITDTTARRIEHPRIDADYPETERNTNTTAFRVSDHDPVVAYFTPNGFFSADLDITKTDSPDPVNAGTNLTYTITATNSGPDPATTASWSDTIPAGTTFVSLSSVAGWSCSNPGVGNNGLVSCSTPSFAVGSAVFTLVVHVDATVAAGTVLSNTASLTSPTSDPDSGDRSDTETTTVAASADLQISKTDSPDPVTAGSNITYQLTLTNNGPSNAASATFSDTLPAGTTFVSLSTTGPWSCTTPAVGANGTVSCTNASFGVTVDFFTLVVKVDANVAAGTVLSNTATLSSSTSDPSTGNESATATTTVAASADLVMSKTDSPDPVNAGQNLTYQLTLTNNGPSNAASATFSDTLPTGTTFVSLSTTGPWSCTTPAVGANGTVSCTNASFGVTADFFTLVVNVNPSVAAGTVLSNTATLGSATPEASSGNESATATTTVAASADIAVTKVDTPDPVNAGSNITYTITVNNNGPSNASTVNMSDTLPTGTTFVSLSSPGGWSCTTPAVGAGGTGSCSNANLAPGSSVFTLTVQVDPSTASSTIISNTASTTSATSDPSTGNESATATTTVSTSADLSITKVDTPDPVTAGTNLTYTITVTNNGPSNALNATLADTLPANTTFVSLSSPGGWSCTTPAVGASGTVNCSNANLAPGSNVFTLVVLTDPSLANGAVITNTASTSTTTSDPNGANNSATATTTVGTGSADMSITKSDSPDPVTAGNNLTYTITVTNNGPTNATSATMSDTLPAGTTFVSLASPGGWSCTTPAVGGTGTVNCSNASLAPGSSVFTLVVNVNASLAAGTVLTNTANTSSSTTDPNGANNSATATTTVARSADLSVTKTDSPDPVIAGTNITYTINVTNNGPSNAAAATLADTVPGNTTFVSLAAAAGWSCTTPAVGGTGAISCSKTDMAPGTEGFTLVVNVNSGTAGGTVISNSASVGSATADPNGANNAATATTTVTAAGTFTATKTVTGTFTTGSTVTYTVILTNHLGFTQPDNPTDEFTDVLPAGLTLINATATSGTPTANVGTNTVTWNGSLANNASVTITINATITATSGTITNQGTAHFDADNNGSNESNTPTDDPNAPGSANATAFAINATAAQVTATKTKSGGTVPGTVVTYTVVITNNMGHTQGDNPGDEFTDILPPQLTLISASATSGTATVDIPSRTVHWNGSIANGASVTITINATINAGGTISNQGTVFVDLDNNGTNESQVQTDDPGQPGTADATTFAATGAGDAPTLSTMMLLALMALLAFVAVKRM